MPIYEYQCQQCGHRMEAIQKLHDKPFTKCPECKGALKKLISSPAFQFKGTGWYVTDYAAKKGGESRDSEAKGSKSKDGGESGGSSGAGSESSGGGKKAGDRASASDAGKSTGATKD